MMPSPSSPAGGKAVSGELPLLPNGSADLYALISVPPQASAERIRARVGELYSEALANADHRDIRKRHYYDNLLDLLPRCYDILLNESMRPLYDEYLGRVKTDSSLPDFEEFLKQEGTRRPRHENRDGLLEIRDEDKAPGGLTEAGSTVPVYELPVQNTARQSVSTLAPLLGVVAFVAVLILMRGVFRMSLPLAIGTAIAAAAVTGVSLHFLLSRRAA
jgi:hypothetical protein